MIKRPSQGVKNVMNDIRKVTLIGSENDYEFELPNEIEEMPKDLDNEIAKALFLVFSVLGFKYEKKKDKYGIK